MIPKPGRGSRWPLKVYCAADRALLDDSTLSGKRLRRRMEELLGEALECTDDHFGGLKFHRDFSKHGTSIPARYLEPHMALTLSPSAPRAARLAALDYRLPRGGQPAETSEWDMTIEEARELESIANQKRALALMAEAQYSVALAVAGTEKSWWDRAIARLGLEQSRYRPGFKAEPTTRKIVKA